MIFLFLGMVLFLFSNSSYWLEDSGEVLKPNYTYDNYIDGEDVNLYFFIFMMRIHFYMNMLKIIKYI